MHKCIYIYISTSFIYSHAHIKVFFVWLTLLYSNKLTIWRTESYWQYIALLFYCDCAILHVNIHGLCIPRHKNTFPNCVNGSPRVCQSVFLKNEHPRSEMVTNRWSGWWFGTWILFSTKVGMMIQSDQYFSGVVIPPISDQFDRDFPSYFPPCIRVFPWLC